MEDAVARRVFRRIGPFVVVLFVASYLDRINLGYASLSMNRDLGLSATQYGLAITVFYATYILAEVPSNMLMARFGARLWVSRPDSDSGDGWPDRPVIERFSLLVALELLKRRRAVYHDFYGEPAHQYLERAESATLLALARMGVRHGSFGSDFHSYHNENHALEILDRRLGRVLGQEGVQALPGRDWLALSLFATCHDLRQRETVEFKHGIGNNEAASIAETHRILEVAGFNAKGR